MNLLRHNTGFHLLLIIFVVLTTRILYLLSPAGQIGDADEAVFGMMAQKIQALEEFPIYCWGAHYAGAPVSYIAAAIFYFFGSGFVQLRSAMLPVALFTPILFYFVYRELVGSSLALVGALFLVFCPFLVLRHTMAAYGGYGETYLGTALIILLSWKVQEDKVASKTPYWSLLLGIVCGFFFYVLPLVLPAILAFAFPSIFLCKNRWLRRILPFSLGGLIGNLPMVIYNIIEHGGTFVRAAGRSLSVGREAMHTPTKELIEQIVARKVAYLKAWLASAPKMFGLYLLPESAGKASLVIAGLFLAIILLWYIIYVFANNKISREDHNHHRNFAAYLILLILFQWTANLSLPRHMLPLLLIIPVAVFSVTRNYYSFNKAIILLLLFICGFQTAGWINKMQYYSFDPEPVVNIMKIENIREFYGSYWTTYPIIFSSEGQLIGSPYLLPYNETLSDRRPDYTNKVRNSPAPAFVFAHEEQQLKKQFLEFLEKHNIRAEYLETKGTTIFFELSEPVHALVETHWQTTFTLPGPT